MFDIGFSEFLLIGVVALIVIGPERLPGVARTLGHLFGRMQRYVNEVKSDIQREIELDELKKLRESVEDSAREIEHSVSREFDRAEQEMRELQALVDPSAETARATDPGKAEPLPSPEPAALEREVPRPGTPEAGAATQPAQAPETGRSRQSI